MIYIVNALKIHIYQHAKRTLRAARNPAGRADFSMGGPDPARDRVGSGSGRVLRVGFSSLDSTADLRELKNIVS